MSLSNPKERVPSPVSVQIYWSGQNGTISYKKQDEGEDKPTFPDYPFPLNFALLEDEVAVIKGNNGEMSVYSNWIRTSYGADRTMKVRYNNGGRVIAEGVWKDIKGTVTSEFNKAKWHKLLFGYTVKERVFLIELRGRALMAYSDFRKKFDSRTGMISITGAKEVSDDQGKSMVPVFEVIPYPEGHLERAIDCDKILQEYLDDRIKGEREEPELHGGTQAGSLSQADEKTVDDAGLRKDMLAEWANLLGNIGKVEDAEEAWNTICSTLDSGGFTDKSKVELMEVLQQQLNKITSIGAYEVMSDGSITNKDDDLPF